MKKFLGIILIAGVISIQSTYAGGVLGTTWHLKAGVQRARGPNLGDWGYFVTSTGEGPLRSAALGGLQDAAQAAGLYHTGTTSQHRWNDGDRDVGRGFGIFIHEWLPDHVKKYGPSALVVLAISNPVTAAAVSNTLVDESKQLRDRIEDHSSRGKSQSSSAAR